MTQNRNPHQKSRIEQLDKDIRENAETLIEKGATEQEVADYINDVMSKEEGPQAEELKKNPIRQQNVNRWKNSELAARKAAKAITQNFQKIAENQDRDKHLDNIIAWLTAQVANEILEFDRNPPADGQRIAALQALIAGAATLRKLAYEAAWLDAEQRRVVVGESRHFLQIKKEARELQEKEEMRDAEADCIKNDKVYRGARAILERIADDEIAEQKRRDENDPENGMPDRADKFRETLSQEQAEQLAGILTESQMEQLGILETGDDEQEEQNQEDQDGTEHGEEVALGPPIGSAQKHGF